MKKCPPQHQNPRSDVLHHHQHASSACHAMLACHGIIAGVTITDEFTAPQLVSAGLACHSYDNKVLHISTYKIKRRP